jgi:hypothetical protein
MSETIEINDNAEANPTLEQQEVVQDAQEQAKQNGDRPEWLPEKFANAEELAKAYSNLESKLGNNEQTEEAPVEEQPQTQDEVEKATGLNLNDYYNEYAETGELSEDSFNKLNELGLPKDLVESYMRGQQAITNNMTQDIYDIAGGEQEYKEMLNWASENLSESEIQAYNNALETDVAQAKLTLQGIQAKYQTGSSSEPNLTQGQVVNNRTDVFNSTAEIVSAINDSRYAEDSHYRKQVEDKIGRSNVL